MNKAPFCLRFRTEGDFVNCYFAKRDTQEGATLLASMRRTILEEHREVFTDWKLLMTDAFRIMLLRVAAETGHPIDPATLEMHEEKTPDGVAEQ